MKLDRAIVEEILQTDLRLLPKLRQNAADPVQDRGGVCTGVLADAYRGIGITEYLLKQDVSAFRRNLRESAIIQLQLFERFEAGEPIDPSYVTMLAYKDLFDALVAGDLELGRSLATRMGWRGEEAEAQNAHPFDFAMGYVLRSFVLEGESAVRHLNHFQKVCRERDNRNFEGYAQVFSAIANRDLSGADKAFKTLIKGHEKESKGGGMFANLLDRYLCVWGIGMANLCRWRGLKVSAVPPLIPENLLI